MPPDLATLEVLLNALLELNAMASSSVDNLGDLYHLHRDVADQK